MTTVTEELIEVRPIQKDSANEYNQEANYLATKTKALSIKSQDGYEAAAELLTAIKSMAKKAEEARKRITTPLDQAKSAVMDLFRPTATALENCERHVKGLMIAYSNEQERLRKLEEERLQREAKASEEKERKRLEAIAARAEASGKTEKAEAARQQAAEVFVAAPVVAPTIQKPSGISMKQNWKCRIVNEALIPREYLIPDLQKLDKISKAVKGSLSIPGVEMFSEDILASR